jgi:hypothetical protein
VPLVSDLTDLPYSARFVGHQSPHHVRHLILRQRQRSIIANAAQNDFALIGSEFGSLGPGRGSPRHDIAIPAESTGIGGSAKFRRTFFTLDGFLVPFAVSINPATGNHDEAPLPPS